MGKDGQHLRSPPGSADVASGADHRPERPRYAQVTCRSRAVVVIGRSRYPYRRYPVVQIVGGGAATGRGRIIDRTGDDPKRPAGGGAKQGPEDTSRRTVGRRPMPRDDQRSRKMLLSHRSLTRTAGNAVNVTTAHRHPGRLLYRRIECSGRPISTAMSFDDRLTDKTA